MKVKKVDMVRCADAHLRGGKRSSTAAQAMGSPGGGIS